MVRRSICNGSPAKGIKEGTCLTTLTQVDISNESKGLGLFYFKVPRFGEYASSKWLWTGGSGPFASNKKMWRMVA